jgi:glyceraldehyde 3-phosphate dehydrogenase
VEVVAVNDLTNHDTLAHLFKFDTAHGIYSDDVSTGKGFIKIGSHKIKVFSERDPSKLPWNQLKVDTVLECTGVFRTIEKAQGHIEAGAEKVVLSAPPRSKGFKMIVLGVNDHEINKSITFYSNASCTTNCLAPMLQVVIDNFGFTKADMSTVHAYTADQRLQDAPHKDLRRARAAAQNITPTSTGAAQAAAIVIPQVKDKIFATAYRVPVITGSLVELTCLTKKSATVEEINEVFRKVSKGKLKNILQYSTDELVSSDIVGNPYSSIFDSKLTQSFGKMIKIVSWYDNEAGYSARLAELASRV